MSQAQYTATPQRSFPLNFTKTVASPLSSIVYRSRAKTPLGLPALQELVGLAQQRNQLEAVTGLLVYDFPCFYQWLEGPWDSLERIVHSIRRDPRHTEVEILSATPVEHRVFTGWNMKLATRDADPSLLRQDIMFPLLETVRALRRQPEAVPALLKNLAPHKQSAHQQSALRNSVRKSAVKTQPAAVLENLIRGNVIPELLLRHGAAALIAPPLILEKQSMELAGLLLAANPDSALDLIHRQIGRHRSAVPLFATLLEPAARRLGDLWQADACSEFDMTIALTYLQNAVRLLGTEFLQAPLNLANAPHVLVVPLPGELHSLGAALDSEAMWHEGWSPQSEFPSDNAALGKLLQADWFDVLDLTMSVALQRQHWLPRLKETVRLARRASRNQELIVMVGGRVFADEAATSSNVTADGHHATASHIATDILRMITVTHGQ
jgi:methanogenic corrinoid protein MtbC1